MKRKLVRLTLVLMCCFASSAVFAQEAKQDPMDDPMMKAYMEFAKPGEPHKALSNLVGTWDGKVKMYHDPSGPTESKGTSTYTSLMDGRYIVEKVEGDMMGTPFHGMGIYGYDNMLKKYVSTWIDSMGTGVMYSQGTSSDGGKTIEWTGQSSDPVAGKQQTYKGKMKMLDKDNYHYEMWGPGPDGKDMKMMEIHYTRRN